ncbi:MAG: hypothetical protein ABI778_02830 [Ignavibacteriota bacterium]
MKHPTAAMSRGAWLYVFVFSCLFLLNSCVTTQSASKIFERDLFVGSLEAEKQFGNFADAQSLSIDAFGNIYVVDRGSPGVYKFNPQGDSLRSVVGFGKDHDQFDGPGDIDASLTNSVVVADRNNNRLEIFSKDLLWQASISGRNVGSKIQFGYPLEAKAGQSGNYFLLDGENKRALSVQPATGTQQVITISGAESGAGLNPVSLALEENEFIVLADANSRSLLLFNNALLLRAGVPFMHAPRSSVFSDGNMIYALEKDAGVIRIFDGSDLFYQGSISLPEKVNPVAAVRVYKGVWFILTKKNVIRCEMN